MKRIKFKQYITANGLGILLRLNTMIISIIATICILEVLTAFELDTITTKELIYIIGFSGIAIIIVWFVCIATLLWLNYILPYQDVN